MIVMDVIRRLRINKGLTQSEFSSILGFSQQAVSKWENNTAEPDIETLCKIADYFGCTIDELLGRPSASQQPDDLPQPLSEPKETRDIEDSEAKTPTYPGRPAIVERIKAEIQNSAEIYHRCQEEYKNLEQEIAGCKASMAELKTFMNGIRSNVVKLEELIKDEAR